MGRHGLQENRLGPTLVTLLLAVACGDARESWGAVEQSGEQTRLSDARGDFSDPAIAGSAGADAALVWRAFDGRSDRILAALARDSRWGPVELVSEEGQHHLPPEVTADPRGGFLAVWPARVDGQYDLFACRLGREGTGQPERITRDGGNDIAPVLLTGADGRIWLAWQSDRGGAADIYAAVLAGGIWSAPRQVTRDPRADPRADLQPALGSGPGGEPWIAWTSWRDGTYADGNYEIYARRLEPTQAEAALRVSTSARTDMSPSFVALGDRLALVWSESCFPPITVGELTATRYDNWADKVYQVAWLEGARFGAPLEVRLNQKLSMGSVVSPQFAAAPGPDASELWLYYGECVVRGVFDRSWVMQLCRIDPSGAVSAPVDLSGGTSGATQRYAAATIDQRGWIVDSVLTGDSGVPELQRAELRVRQFASGDLEARQPAPRISGEPRAPVNRNLRLDEAPQPRSEAQLGGARWKVWFGNLHVHSDLSRDRLGFEGGVAENFQVLRDVAALDFAGISDHAEGMRTVDWWDTRALVELYNRPGSFVTLPGYEWTSGNFGHKNVFFASIESASATQPFSAKDHTPEDLWAHLDEREAIAIPHHVSIAMPRPTDWSFRNDRFQRLVEIFQKRGSFEYDGAPLEGSEERFLPGHSVRDALGLGHRLGIIASPDHGGGLGLAGVWASELTRESIWEALLARRTFGTSGAKMDLFLAFEGAAQGAEVVAGGPRIHLSGRVHSTLDGMTLTLLRDGEELERWQEPGSSAAIEWQGEAPAGGPSYYYLRAVQTDGHTGWTSPIWIWPPGSAAPGR